MYSTRLKGKRCFPYLVQEDITNSDTDSVFASQIIFVCVLFIYICVCVCLCLSISFHRK